MSYRLPVHWSAKKTLNNEYTLRFVGSKHAHAAIRYATERRLQHRYIYNANGCYGMYSRTDAEVDLDPVLYEQECERKAHHRKKQYEKNLKKYQQEYEHYKISHEKWQHMYNEWLADGPRQVVHVGCVAPESIQDDDYGKLFPEWGKNRKVGWRFFISNVPTKRGKVRIMCDRPKEFPIQEPLKPSEPRTT